MKLIIDISEEIYQEAIKSGYSHLYDEDVANAVADGTPLDDVKAEISEIAKDYDKFADYRRVRGLWIALEILDNIGKGESQKLANVGFLNQSLEDAIDCS